MHRRNLDMIHRTGTTGSVGVVGHEPPPFLGVPPVSPWTNLDSSRMSTGPHIVDGEVKKKVLLGLDLCLIALSNGSRKPRSKRGGSSGFASRRLLLESSDDYLLS